MTKQEVKDFKKNLIELVEQLYTQSESYRKTQTKRHIEDFCDGQFYVKPYYNAVDILNGLKVKESPLIPEGELWISKKDSNKLNTHTT